MKSYVFIFLVVLVVLFLLRSRKKKRPASHPLVSQRSYMASSVPALLKNHKVFSSSYLSRYASAYRKSGRAPAFTEKDLLPGVDSSHAAWVLNHCERLASARFSAVSAISNAEKSEAHSVVLTVDRACPGCVKVPGVKTYKVGSRIPVYPCADCSKDQPCIFYYKVIF